MTSQPSDDMSSAQERTPDTAAAPDEGWRRWMPRRRTDVAATSDDPTPPPGAATPAEPGEDAPDGGPHQDPTAEGAAAAPAAEGERPGRRWMPRRRATPPAGEPPVGAESTDGADVDTGAEADAVTAAAADDGVGRLRRRRKRLLGEREVTVYHLGGLAFELYRHDRLHPEVMRRRAGEIALIDETVHDIDLRLEQLATDRRNRRTRDADPRTPVGNCMACRAPFQVDARFCWQCGAQLAPELPDPPADIDLDEQATQTIERPAP